MKQQDDGELADDGDQDDEKTAEAELATEDEFTVIEQDFRSLAANGQSSLRTLP